MASVASSKQMTHHPNFSKTMELRWANRPNTRKPRQLQFPPSTGPSSLPIYISTRPGHVDPSALRDLYASCDFSCHRFPNVGPDRRVREDDAVGLDKLRIALAHSSVVVSVFCRDEDLSPDAEQSASVGIGGLMSKMLPRVDPSDGRLVGFGRAVSDLGLTASIYDVMCLPGYSFASRNGNCPDDCPKNCKVCWLIKFRSLQRSSQAETYMTSQLFVQKMRGHFLKHVDLEMTFWAPQQ